jgi:chromosome segregation ATPase
MKIFRYFFDDRPNFAVKRQGSTTRAKNSFDQDDEQFLPAAMQSDQRKNAALDAEGRCWPELPIISQNRIVTLESKIAKQSAELTQRCTQVADLCNIREQQAIELHDACDQIDRLSESIAGLQGTIMQYETETAAAKQKLILLDNERFALRAQLDKVKVECADLLQRSLRAETALNDKNIVIASAQEKIENLKAKLIAIPAETIRLTTAIKEEANTRNRHELNQQRAYFDNQVKKLEGVVAKRDMLLKDLEIARAELSERCNDLSKTVSVLESARQFAQERIELQTGHIQAFETMSRIEREAMELKIKELTVELQCERVERSVAERMSAAIRKNIVLLLPRLAARRNPPLSREQEKFVPHNNAA